MAGEEGTTWYCIIPHPVPITYHRKIIDTIAGVPSPQMRVGNRIPFTLKKFDALRVGGKAEKKEGKASPSRHPQTQKRPLEIAPRLGERRWSTGPRECGTRKSVRDYTSKNWSRRERRRSPKEGKRKSKGSLHTQKLEDQRCYVKGSLKQI